MDLNIKTLPNRVIDSLSCTYQFILVQELLVSIPGTRHLGNTAVLLSICDIQEWPCTLLFLLWVPPYYGIFWDLLEFSVKRMIHWYVGLQMVWDNNTVWWFWLEWATSNSFWKLKVKETRGNSKLSKVSYWILALNMQDHPFWGLKIV